MGAIVFNCHKACLLALLVAGAAQIASATLNDQATVQPAGHNGPLPSWRRSLKQADLGGIVGSVGSVAGAVAGAGAAGVGAIAGAGSGIVGAGTGLIELTGALAGLGGIQIISRGARSVGSGVFPFVLRDFGGAASAGNSIVGGVTGSIMSIVNPITSRVLPVRAAPRRSDCVVYTPGYLETLGQVSSRLGVPTDQLLRDNVGAISSASESLVGRVILVCGLPQGQRVSGGGGGGGTGRGGATPPPPAVEPAAPKPTVQGADRLLAPAKTQEAALLSIKSAVDPKGMIGDWKPNVGPYCKWINVVCDGAGNVVTLTLSYLGLEGQLPPASALKDLPALQGLLLGGNALKGNLPDGYGETSLRELYLNDNQLSGSLPGSWSKNKNFREISVAFNQISGPLPAEWGTLSSLTALKLNSNKLAGPFPKEWANLGSSLQTLTIFENAGLSGCIPSSLSKFQGRSGAMTRSLSDAASGTKISAFC